ncbi:MAG TPA: sugar phosphate isomerase/epimerase [Acidobacteriaceae bacterium]|jgi:sugar phosphate isomerase/epimerase|nr:sugar phosphate isomerase/epimerase [Acidobacteriaceae bacterium]
MNAAFSRRSFLASSALAAGAAWLPTSAAALAPPMEPRTAGGAPSPVKLGLASYTFRDFSRAQLIGFMKDLNLTDLNCKDAKDHLPMDPAAEAQALADYKAAGIRLHAAGNISLATDSDDVMRGKFEYLKRANIPVMVAGDPAPHALPRVEKFVKEYNIKLAIHNHGPEDKVWPSPLDVLKDVRNLDPRMGCCIDVGHTVRAGTDVVEAIHAVGPRLFNMHMKDLTDFNDKGSQVAVGDGKMPVHAIFEALIATKYPGFVDLEYEVHENDPMPGVTKSYAYMRGVLAGMGYRSSAT